MKIIIEAASVEELREVAAQLTGGAPAVEVTRDIPGATPEAMAAPGLTAEPEPEPPSNEPVSGPAPELDADGLPWDERIHSSNGAKNADGRWRRKRGVQEALVNKVEAELRGEPAAPPPPAAEPAAPPPPAAEPAAPPPPAADNLPRTFEELNALVVQRAIAGTLDNDAVEAELAKHGLKTFGDLGMPANADKIPHVAAGLDLCTA